MLSGFLLFPQGFLEYISNFLVGVLEKRGRSIPDFEQSQFLVLDSLQYCICMFAEAAIPIVERPSSKEVRVIDLHQLLPQQ